MNRRKTKSGFPRVAWMVLLAGAAFSVGFMLWAGRHNGSRILMLLFVLWVLSPFVALALAAEVSKRRSVETRAAIYRTMPILTLGSLAIYGYFALRPPVAKMASVFVVTPAASLILIAAIVPLFAFLSRRSTS